MFCEQVRIHTQERRLILQRFPWIGVIVSTTLIFNDCIDWLPQLYRRRGVGAQIIVFP